MLQPVKRHVLSSSLFPLGVISLCKVLSNPTIQICHSWSHGDGSCGHHQNARSTMSSRAHVSSEQDNGVSPTIRRVRQRIMIIWGACHGVFSPMGKGGKDASVDVLARSSPDFTCRRHFWTWSTTRFNKSDLFGRCSGHLSPSHPPKEEERFLYVLVPHSRWTFTHQLSLPLAPPTITPDFSGTVPGRYRGSCQ